jgi:septal ring factor EnvC (AmiA/AmiB activator)
MASSADLVGTYEALYPIVWQYYEAHLKFEANNQIASDRIAGMSSAVQNLWQDLTKASSDASIVQQDLGSQSARVASLEATLIHSSKVIAESNEHRDRYFAELGQAHHRIGLQEQELAEAAALVAATRLDKADAILAVKSERNEVVFNLTTELTHYKSETAQLHEIVASMRRSTSWRLTSPMRKVIAWILRR